MKHDTNKNYTPLLKSASRFLRGGSLLAKLFAVLLSPVKRLCAKSFDKQCVQKTKGCQVKIIHFGRIVPYLALCLLAFGVKIKTAQAEDCSCCGGCNIDDIVGAITNASQSACSSNCVSMTPQDCEYFKNEVTSVCVQEQTIIYHIDSYIDEVQRNWEQVIYKARVVKEEAENIRSFIHELSSTNLPSNANINDRLDIIENQLISLTNVWTNIEGPTPSNIIVSNSYTYIVQQIPKVFKPARYIVQNVFPNIVLLREEINSSHINFAEVEDSLDTIIESMEEIYNSAIGSQLSSVDDDLYYLNDKTVELYDLAQSLDCSPCGKGGDSSSGGSSGGSSTDLSPIIYEVQYLRERLEFHLQRLYDLLRRYYDDYTSAANNPVTFHSSSSDLAGMKNWFSRVEMLLYNVQDGRGELFTDYVQARSNIPSFDPDDYGSGQSANNWFIRVEQLLGMIASPKGNDVVGNDLPTDPPEDISNSEYVDDFDTEKEQADANAEQAKTSIDNSIHGGWERVRQSLSNLAQSFSNRFGGQYTNIDGMSMEIQVQVGDSPTVDLLQIPEGFSGRMKILRDILNVFWLILFSVLYIGAFKMLVSVTIKYILWFAQVSSATFGS